MQNKIYCCYHYPAKRESIFKKLFNLSGQIVGAFLLVGAAWLFIVLYWAAFAPLSEL